MKTKYFVLVFLFIIGSSPLLLGFKKTKPYYSQYTYPSFVQGLQFGSLTQSGYWYEGKINGAINLSGTQVIKGTFGFGNDENQQLWRFQGEIGPYELDLEYLFKNNMSLVRVSSFVVKGESLYPFMETLAKTALNNKGSFVYLRNFYPYSGVGLIFKSKQILEQLLPFTTFYDSSCISRECQIIIDTDLLANAILEIDPLVANYLAQTKNQRIIYNSQEGKVFWEGLQASGITTNGSFMTNNLNLEVDSKGLMQRVTNLNYNFNYNHPIIELQLTQENKKVQHWKLYSSTWENAGSLFINDALNGGKTNLWLEWTKKGRFTPIDVGKNIDIYTLLGK